MKLAVASDLHLGDTSCSLVCASNGKAELGARYPAFRDAVGQGNRYLILLGDVFDFSVASFDKVFDAAQVFFTAVREDGLTEDIIYVPGNHDFSVWSLLSQQINVINRVARHKTPKTDMTKTGILLETPDAAGRHLFLGDSDPGPSGKFGGLFLDKLFYGKKEDQGVVECICGADQDDPTKRPPHAFKVAFPNLYFVTADGQTILMTHGHLLDSFWSFMSEFAPFVAQGDLVLKNREEGPLTIEEWCQLNFPLNELSSGSLGQSGALVDVIHNVQIDVKGRGDRTLTKRYMGRTLEYVQKALKSSHNPLKNFLYGLAREHLETMLGRKLDGVQMGRLDEEFFDQPAVKGRIAAYLASCGNERAMVAKRVAIPEPDTILCGHTHVPIPLEDRLVMVPGGSKPVRILNTGGWLGDPAAGYNKGAVFHYESGKGFRSVLV